MESKENKTASLLAFLVGFTGAHNFYLGNKVKGAQQLTIFLLTAIGSAIGWPIWAMLNAEKVQPGANVILILVVVLAIGLLCSIIWGIIDGIKIKKGVEHLNDKPTPKAESASEEQ